MSSPAAHNSGRRRSLVEGQGVLEARSPDHVHSVHASLPQPGSQTVLRSSNAAESSPPPPVDAAADAALLGNIVAHKRKSVSIAASQIPAALTPESPPAAAPPPPQQPSVSPQTSAAAVPPHAILAALQLQPAHAPRDAAAAPGDVRANLDASPPPPVHRAATALDPSPLQANAAAASAAPSVASSSASPNAAGRRLSLGALLKAKKLFESENAVGGVAAAAAAASSSAALSPHSLSSASDLQPGIDDHVLPAAAAFHEQPVVAAAPQGVGAALTEEEEQQRLLVKAKLDAQNIQFMRMRGDAVDPGCAHSAPAFGSFESYSAPHFAEKLLIMEQTMHDERATAQRRISELEQQLQQSNSLLQASMAHTSCSATESTAAATELISSLQKQIDESNSARALHQSQTADLITGIRESLESRTRELQAQVAAYAAASEKRNDDAALAAKQLQLLRASLTLASDHAQAALRARVQGSGAAGEPMHHYLWARSCGWYLKDASGEQHGPLDMAVLAKAAKQSTSCWCEGFTKWLPYEHAMAAIKLAPAEAAGKRPATKRETVFDAPQFHVAQVCFLHSRASDALERLLAMFPSDAESAAENSLSLPPAHTAADAPRSSHRFPDGYPSEVLEAMFRTVSN
jgi:hypothetical protein